MVEQLGKIALSFLITNWLYAEALLFVPQLRPVCQRIIATVRIPTHVEWPAIMTAKAAGSLGSDINNYLASSSLRPAFEKVGVLDHKVQKLQQAVHASSGSPYNAFGAVPTNHTYNSDDNIFVNASDDHARRGGYRSFTL